MIDLVLQAAREQAIGGDFLGGTRAIQITHPDLIEPADLAELLGQAEATFLRDVAGLRAPYDLWVDDIDRRPLAVAAEVRDERPPEHADLGRSQADAGRRVH